MRLSEVLGAGEGTYVGAHFSKESIHALVELQEEIGVPNPVPPTDFHTTIVYSRNTIDWTPAVLNVSAGVVGYRVFGDETRILVLELDCPTLTDRFEEAMDSGATYDFPEYIPHITLSYDIGDFNIDVLNPPTLRLIVAQEFVDDL